MPRSGWRPRVRIVLVVDDDECVRELYGSALRDAGLTVAEAATVNEAIERALSIEPDAIVLDRELPDGDGFDLVRVLTDAGVRRAPIIGFSAHADARTAARNVGCDAFVRKPCPPADLVRCVAELLDRKDEETLQTG